MFGKSFLIVLDFRKGTAGGDMNISSDPSEPSANRGPYSAVQEHGDHHGTYLRGRKPSDKAGLCHICIAKLVSYLQSCYSQSHPDYNYTVVINQLLEL